MFCLLLFYLLFVVVVFRPRVRLKRLYQICHVHWHFVDLRRVILLDITKNPDVVCLYEINRHTLAAETSGSAYPVNVQLTIVWQIVVDYEGHLLHINTSRPNVGCDQNSATKKENKYINIMKIMLKIMQIMVND